MFLSSPYLEKDYDLISYAPNSSPNILEYLKIGKSNTLYT